MLQSAVLCSRERSGLLANSVCLMKQMCFVVFCGVFAVFCGCFASVSRCFASIFKMFFLKQCFAVFCGCFAICFGRVLQKKI